MHGYNTIEAQIHYPRYTYSHMVECIASVTALINYCPDNYPRYSCMVEGS